MILLSQAEIIVNLLEAKEQEILNYDMDEAWAVETLEAIEAVKTKLKNEIFPIFPL